MDWNTIGKTYGSIDTDDLIYDISDKPYMTCNEIANIILNHVKQQVEKFESFKDFLPEHILTGEQNVLKDYSIKCKFQDADDVIIKKMHMPTDEYYSLSWISLTCHPRTCDMDDNGRSTILIRQFFTDGDEKRADKKLHLSIHSKWYGIEAPSMMSLAMLYIHNKLSCITRAFMINYKNC